MMGQELEILAEAASCILWLIFPAWLFIRPSIRTKWQPPSARVVDGETLEVRGDIDGLSRSFNPVGFVSFTRIGWKKWEVKINTTHHNIQWTDEAQLAADYINGKLK